MRLAFNILLIIIFTISACRKEEEITIDSNAKLSISKDSILFDTIFTSIASTIKKIQIYNYNKKALNISSIILSGGTSSAFSININGSDKNNLILNGQDSLNIFVKANIPSNNNRFPFLVKDSILINVNGNKSVVHLLAYGQNAVFINGSNINSNTTWTNHLPYVINDALTIKNGSCLTIQPGTKIYFHKDATLNIEGSLIAEGNLANPILFASDRLEKIYNNEPGQWKGIYLKETGIALIKNTLIKNASVAITSDSMSKTASPKLILANNIIKNMQVAAYIGYHSELLAFNNLIYNCGNYIIYGVGGGKYNLKQNTFVGINPNLPRKTPALTFSDYFAVNSTYNSLQLDIVNNIIWGTLTNELDIQKKANNTLQANLSNNLVKINNLIYTGNILNANPFFVAPDLENFELLSISPAVKQGKDISTDFYFSLYLNKDSKDKVRIHPSSLGCYENY